MTYVINEPCIGTGHIVRRGLPGRLHPSHPGRARLRPARAALIDPEECIDCDACVEACPVDAITSEDMVPSEWHKYIEINAAYFREQAA